MPLKIVILTELKSVSHKQLRPWAVQTMRCRHGVQCCVSYLGHKLFVVNVVVVVVVVVLLLNIGRSNYSLPNFRVASN